ncbi:hypothetical protein GE061_019243 [Apolygus lucorum]|uniref:Uncharacterized protein n=1 Tax=Apolygus lucorum TaxID=248454 RepID=A0A8S9XAI6_APOLU|nr:hypothetical protein GE061_019243 [Apolygus lucorum]
MKKQGAEVEAKDDAKEEENGNSKEVAEKATQEKMNVKTDDIEGAVSDVSCDKKKKQVRRRKSMKIAKKETIFRSFLARKIIWKKWKEKGVGKDDEDEAIELPTPYQSPIGHGHTTSIPTPLSLRHNQSVHPVSSSPLKCPSTSSSRSTSPSHSFIPTVRSQGRAAAPEKQSIQRVSAARTPQTPASSPYSTPVKNNSMLDKLKLFNQKDKPKQVSGSAKRTSSSSGFSSARSERSDSSTSLHSDAKSSTIEKKEGSQNDLNKSHLRKKVVKADSKIVRPGKTSGSNSRLPQQPTPAVAVSAPPSSQIGGQLLTYPGSINRGTLRHLEPPSSGQVVRPSSDPRTGEGRCSPALKRRGSPQLELAQPANPPPPPAPSCHTVSPSLHATLELWLPLLFFSP